MSRIGIEAYRSLVKGLEAKDESIVSTELKKTYNAMIKAGVTSISDDFIFTIAEDKLDDFLKEIDGDELVLDTLPEVKSIEKSLTPKGMRNILIRHDGSDALFEKSMLKTDKNLSAAVSAIMMRRS